MIEKKRRFFIKLVSRIVSFCLLIQATVLILSLYACDDHRCWRPGYYYIPKEIRIYDTSITVEQHVATLMQRLDEYNDAYYERFYSGTSITEEEWEAVKMKYKVYPIYSFDGYAEYFLVTKSKNGHVMLVYCEGEYYITQYANADMTLWGTLGILDDPNYKLYCYYDFAYDMVYTGYGKTEETGKIWSTKWDGDFYYSHSSGGLSERDVEWALEKNLVHNSWDCWCIKDPENTQNSAFKGWAIGW